MTCMCAGCGTQAGPTGAPVWLGYECGCVAAFWRSDATWKQAAEWARARRAGRAA